MIRPVLSVAVIVALLVGGCGSSGSSEDTEDAQDAGGLNQLPVVAPASGSTQPPSTQNAASRNAFLREVFDDAQAMWSDDFADGEVEYRPARLTIFMDRIRTACGEMSATAGPFYCPPDRGVYLDSRFFDALARRVGVRLGDFAQAYVVAHEVAHHVQFVLGLGQRLNATDRRDPAGRHWLTVGFEDGNPGDCDTFSS